MNSKKKISISWNSPAVLTFALICVVVMGLEYFFKGKVTSLLFSVRHTSLTNPLTYVRMVGHVLGHADWEHLMGNIMYILILGPMLEEKYGTSNLCFLMFVTALVTGVIHYIFFPSTVLLGASGIVFAMILLSSITSFRADSIPLTFILVAVLYLGEQIYNVFAGEDNVSYMAHIVGAIVGVVLGFLMNHWKMNRYGRR